MSNIQWKYVVPLRTGKEIEALETRYSYSLPEDLKACVRAHNAGMPSLSKFDLGETKEMVFGGLLSFNEGDDDSVYDIIGRFEVEQGKRLSMFPFGIDPFGNFYCVKESKVVFYDCEIEKTRVISDTFSDFLNMLY